MRKRQKSDVKYSQIFIFLKFYSDKKIREKKKLKKFVNLAKEMNFIFFFCILWNDAILLHLIRNSWINTRRYSEWWRQTMQRWNIIMSTIYASTARQKIDKPVVIFPGSKNPRVKIIAELIFAVLLRGVFHGKYSTLL